MRGTPSRGPEDEVDGRLAGEADCDAEGQAEAEAGRAADIEAAKQGQAETRGDRAAPSRAPAWSRPSLAVAHERDESRRASARPAAGDLRPAAREARDPRPAKSRRERDAARRARRLTPPGLGARLPADPAERSHRLGARRWCARASQSVPPRR